MSKNTRWNRVVVEEIMGKKIPSVMKTINSQIKKQIANKANTKKTNDKEKSLKKKKREKKDMLYTKDQR